MHNAVAFLAGIALGGGAAVAASLPITFPIDLDWRIPALALSIAGGIVWGVRQSRRPR